MSVNLYLCDFFSAGESRQTCFWALSEWNRSKMRWIGRLFEAKESYGHCGITEEVANDLPGPEEVMWRGVNLSGSGS